MKYYVYVIKSKSTDKIYIGQTNNINERLTRHNKKAPSKKTSYTSKNKGPWKLIYKENFSTRKEVIKREAQLKSYRGRLSIKNM